MVEGPGERSGSRQSGPRNAVAGRYWKPAEDFIGAHLEPGAPSPHLHDEWQFAVPDQAGALLVGAFGHSPVRASEVTVVQPYDVHGESGGGAWSVLYVARAIMARHFHGRPFRCPPSRSIADPAAGAGLVTLLRDSRHGAVGGSAFEASALDWLEHLARRTAAEPPARRSRRPRPAVERAREHLTEHPGEGLTLAEMASVAGMGASHLVRSFSRDVGLPPKSYHTQARLALARRLLAEDRPVTWVAYECGFADQSHLSRRFKAAYGLTPGSFQAQCLRRPVPEPGSDAA